MAVSLGLVGRGNTRLLVGSRVSIRFISCRSFYSVTRKCTFAKMGCYFFVVLSGGSGGVAFVLLLYE